MDEKLGNIEKQLSEFENSNIESLDYFDKGDVIILKSYNIINVKSLLGATKGLKNNSIFSELPNGDSKYKQFIDHLLDILLSKYRNFKSSKKMGWLGEQ